MKTLARLVLWLCVVAVAAGAMAAGMGGMIFLPSLGDVVLSFALAACATVLGAIGMDRLVGIALDDVKLDVLVDWIRVRNCRRRRRAWRSYAAALAGETTAASFAAYRVTFDIQ